MRQDCEQNSVKIANNEICIRDYLFCNYLNNDFKVHTAYIAEVKRSFGLPMYDAPNAIEILKSKKTPHSCSSRCYQSCTCSF